MKVRVRYFAVLRERRQRDEEVVTLAEPLTVSQLYRHLFPPGPDGVLPVMYAVDRNYVSAGHLLEDGAEVAFIPPLGGG